jgi:hypothetical protein
VILRLMRETAWWNCCENSHIIGYRTHHTTNARDWMYQKMCYHDILKVEWHVYLLDTTISVATERLNHVHGGDEPTFSGTRAEVYHEILPYMRMMEGL